MSCFLNTIKDLVEYNELSRAVDSNRLPMGVLGLSHIHKAHFIHSLCEEKKRKAAIEENYERALSQGDKNVYFIPGDTLMDERVQDCGTIDGIHPTDAGFFSMACVIAPVIKKILSL